MSEHPEHQSKQERMRELLEILEQTLDRNPARYTPKAVGLEKAHKLVVAALSDVTEAGE